MARQSFLRESPRFIGFVLAGGSATLVNYFVFLGLLSLGINYLFASGVGYVTGIGVSYVINKAIVFRQSGGARAQFARYVGAYLVALCAQLGLLWVLVSSGIIAEIANAIAISVVVVLNYFVVRKFVFIPANN